MRMKRTEIILHEKNDSIRTKKYKKKVSTIAKFRFVYFILMYPAKGIVHTVKIYLDIVSPPPHAPQPPKKLLNLVFNQRIPLPSG